MCDSEPLHGLSSGIDEVDDAIMDLMRLAEIDECVAISIAEEISAVLIEAKNKISE